MGQVNAAWYRSYPRPLVWSEVPHNQLRVVSPPLNTHSYFLLCPTAHRFGYWLSVW